MSIRSALRDLRIAIGPWRRVRAKLGHVARTLRNTVDWRERRRRMKALEALGRIDTLPTEWQVAVASYQMMTEYILPSNNEFFAHVDRDETWTLFLRALEEPSAMLDPSGLAIDRDVLVKHLLHAVHCSAGYDVGLLEIFPDGLDELERQLNLAVRGEHPDQEALDGILERPDYHQRLLEALRRYRADPDRHWKVITFEAPEDCQSLFQEGLERFGTIGRLLRHAARQPRSPWEHLGLV